MPATSSPTQATSRAARLIRIPDTPLLTLGALAAALGLAIIEANQAASVSFDAARYLELARAFHLRGLHGALDWYSGPIFPVIVGTVYPMVGSLEWTGRLVGLAFAALFVLSVHALAAELFSRRIGTVAAALVGTHAALIRHAVTAEIDVPYLGLLSFALLCAYRSYASTVRRYQLAWAIAAGVSFALAYLTRPEGLIVCIVLSLGLVGLYRGTARGLRLGLPVLAVAVALSLPYLCWLRAELGRWTLSGKDRTLSLKFLPDKKHPERALKAGVLGALWQNPDDLIDWLPTHLRRTLTELPKANGYLILPLAIVGLVRLRRTGVLKRNRFLRSALLACLLPVLGFALLYPYERYFMQALPITGPLAAIGLVSLQQRLAHLRTRRIGSALVIVVLATNLTIAAVQAREPIESSRTYKRQIGERIRRLVGPGRRVLAFTIEAFYAEADRVKRWDPFEGIVPGHGFGQPFTYESMLEFVRKHRVEVLVVDHHFRKDCPDFMEKVRPEHFRLLFQVEHKGEPIYVYRTMPTLLEPPGTHTRQN